MEFYEQKKVVVDELAGVDLVSEMELIRQKRSRLSSRLRKLVQQRLAEQILKENPDVVDITS